MLSLLCVLLVEVEDVFNALRCELIAQRRRFTPPPLAVVESSHRVGPPVAISHPEPDLVLGEHLLEGFTVHTARIKEGLHHLVAENLLEAAVLEAVAPQVPVGLGLLRVREHLTPLVAHELIVHLAKPPRPRPAA